MEALQFYVSGFWVWLGITVGIAVIIIPVIRYPFISFRRYLRSRNIAAHGWPTNPLMDADGDIIHPPVKKDED